MITITTFRGTLAISLLCVVAAGCAPKIQTNSAQAPLSGNAQLLVAAIDDGGGDELQRDATDKKTEDTTGGGGNSGCGNESRRDDLNSLSKVGAAIKGKTQGLSKVASDPWSVDVSALDSVLADRVQTRDLSGSLIKENNLGSFRMELGAPARSIAGKKAGKDVTLSLDKLTGTTTVARIDADQMLISDGKVAYLYSGSKKSVTAEYTNLSPTPSAGKLAVSKLSTGGIGEILIAHTDCLGKQTKVLKLNTVSRAITAMPIATNLSLKQ